MHSSLPPGRYSQAASLATLAIFFFSFAALRNSFACFSRAFAAPWKNNLCQRRNEERILTSARRNSAAVARASASISSRSCSSASVGGAAGSPLRQRMADENETKRGVHTREKTAGRFRER